MKTTTRLTLLSLALLYAPSALGDTFGSDSSTFDIEFVTIGNPGKAADTTGDPNPAGSVAYTYRMGKYEISEGMIDKANAVGGLGITKTTRGPNKPTTSVSWFEATQFVNWLNNSTSHPPAYKFDVGGNFELWLPGDAGYNSNNPYRNSLAYYFLPSVDEWYKAAYYDPIADIYYNYPTGSDTKPTAVASGTAAGTAVYVQSSGQGPADITLAGGLSPYGTMGQGGNVWEWGETDFDLVNDSTSSTRGVRGGSWVNSFSGSMLSSSRNFLNPSDGSSLIGFRVASIPEPSTLVLGMAGLLSVLWCRRAVG